MIKNLIIIGILFLFNSARLDAQDQPSPIDRIDIFDNYWVEGYNVKVLDSIVVGVGTARQTGVSQGMHISSYSFDGDVLYSAFIYDSIDFISITPNDIHDIVDLGDNRFFTCIHGYYDICYSYDAINQNFDFIDTISTKYSDRFLFPDAIKAYEEDIYVVSTIGDNENRRLSVLKYGLDSASYDVFGEVSPYWFSGELIVGGEDEWTVIYANSDINKNYLFRKKAGNIKQIGIISEEMQTGPIRSALIHENDEIVYCTNLTKYTNGQWDPSWIIVRIDSLGKTVGVTDLESVVNMETDPIVASGNTQIPTLIDAVGSDGVIFVGYDYEVIDTFSTGRGVVGKVSYNGELKWVRKYRHITEDGYRNQFYDIDYDGFGGYIVYGTVESPTLEPFPSAAWLMRLDSDGMPIDTTTSVIEVTSIVETVHPYPNPGADYISFDLDNKEVRGAVPIRLLSQDGQALGKYEMVDKKLNIGLLPAGLYYFKYELGGTLHTGKFVKQ